jgi:hypothetical protein
MLERMWATWRTQNLRLRAGVATLEQTTARAPALFRIKPRNGCRRPDSRGVRNIEAWGDGDRRAWMGRWKSR